LIYTLKDLNLLLVSLRELQTTPSGTGSAESIGNTGSPPKVKDMQTASFLSSLPKGLLSFYNSTNPSNTSKKDVNRTLSLKETPLQTGIN
jgi:hypothetical protein